MKYISAKEYAQLHNVSVRWVQEMCKKGKIVGATRINETGAWLIPDETNNDITLKNEERSEVIRMVNAEKQMETGKMLMDNFDFDMASLYFEFAGEEFVRRGDYKNALEAYTKMLYCFENDEKEQSRIEDVRKIIFGIKGKMEV